MNNGWEASADAWIEVMGYDGDWGRRHVLDAPMLARIDGRGFTRAVDIGCGEGRFCRMLQARGIATIGIDPTAALIRSARLRDPQGEYRIAGGEDTGVADASVDLAIAYLSLIDIPDLGAAIREARRMLQPGGTFLIANLQGFNTAAVDPSGWAHDRDGELRFAIDHYLEERVQWVGWRGIRIQNHHRPLSTYLQGLLDAGFALRHFAEPAPHGIDDDKADRYRRVPNFLLMEWQKTG